MTSATRLDPICEKALGGEPLTPAEGLELYRTLDLPSLGLLADSVRQRLNPGKDPAVYAPGPGAPEELEIEEPEMIEAIEHIRTVIEKRRPHKGRLRGALLLGALAAVIGLGVYWVPDALVRHASMSASV